MRTNRARKLGEQSVAHELECTPVMLCEDWVYNVSAYLTEGRQRPALVLAYELAIADHVGTKDRR
jgi:hypothetical protein